MRVWAMMLLSDERAFARIASPMRCDALATPENLDGAGRGANFDPLADKRVRYDVVVIAERDVIVDVDTSVRPLARFEARRR